MRCHLVKDARVVATKELPDLSIREAVKTARTMFDGSSYEAVEVWSFTRRICELHPTNVANGRSSPALSHF